MKILELKPEGFPLKLGECPPGFFLFKMDVCFKSNYSDFFCDTGEAFWGGVSDKEARANLIVQPLFFEWSEQ